MGGSWESSAEACGAVFFRVQTKKERSCVLDLNDALLRLYNLPPKNRNEKKQKNYVTNCTTNYSSKNLAVKFLLYVLEHTNLASTIKKKNTLNLTIHHHS